MVDTRVSASSGTPSVPILPQYPFRSAFDLPEGVVDRVIQREPDRASKGTHAFFLSVVADCLHLESELKNNAPRIIKFTSSVTAIAGVSAAYGAINAKRNSVDVPVYAKAAGGAAVLFGGWAGWELYQARQVKNEWNAMQCAGVLKLFHPERATAPVPTAEARVATAPCVGADVLMGNCTPVRRLAPSYEWSTQPVLTTDALYLVGGVVLVAVVWEVAATYSAASATSTALEWAWAAATAL